MADGALRGTVLVGLVLVAGAWLRPPTSPVADRILRIEGEVTRPGWYEADDLGAAVRVAGGRTPKLTSDVPRDGDVVRIVGRWALPDRAVAPVESMVLGRKLRLNDASQEDLEALPGIGPALARRIVEGRPYRSVAEVDRVRGIGPAKLRILAERTEP